MKNLRQVLKGTFYIQLIIILITSKALGWYDIVKYESKDKYQYSIQGIVFEDVNNNNIQDIGEHGLSGVGVSDGRDVILTDNSGAFLLKNTQQDANIVFISIPENYVKGEIFYFLLDSDMQKQIFNFPLVPASKPEAESFSFIHTTDIHIWSNAEIPDFEKKIQRMDKMAPAAKFVVCTGDLSADNKIETLRDYKKSIAVSKNPWLSAFGNHDELYEYDYTRHYRKVLGPDYYSFDYGGWHFIIFNSIHLDDHKMNTNWFEQDVKLLGKKKPIIIFKHYHPENKHFERWVQHKNIKAVFSGHLHGIKNIIVNDIKSYNTSPFRFAGIDYTPAGFRIVHINKQHVTTEYKFFSNEQIVENDTKIEMTNSELKIDKNMSWKEYKNSSARSGYVDNSIDLPLEKIWTTQLDGNILYSSPVIKSGNLYIAVRNFNEENRQFLYCLNASDGTIQWCRELTAPILLSPTIYKDKLYFQTQTGAVYSYSLKGEQQWQFQVCSEIIPWMFAAPIVENDIIYTGNTAYFSALNSENGKVIWQVNPGNIWNFSNAIPAASNNWITTGTIWSANNLICIAKKSGATLKNIKSEGIANAVIAVDSGIIIQDYRGKIQLFDYHWNVKWEYKMKADNWTIVTPSVAKNKVVAVSSDGEIICLNLKNGQVLWTFQTSKGKYDFIPYHKTYETICSSPIINKDYVLFGASNRLFYILNIETGQLIQSITLNSPITSTPALLNNAVFIATFDGCIHALGKINAQ